MNPPSWEMIIGLCALGTAIGGILIGAIKLGSVLRHVEEHDTRFDKLDGQLNGTNGSGGLARMIYEMKGERKAERGEDTT
jgi:hypothetical protein